LFQGLHGTVIQIIDVILGFLVICSGVVLLQLAKSAKDVPDTEVFKGDLDQVRTVAEVEEPEYEPRADTIRGGAGIVRAMSKVRTKRQAEEAKRIHEDLGTIGENDEFEWDGLRRRKTVSSNGRSATGSLSRRKTVHPPLGMAHFPEQDDAISEPDSEVHPGFFGRIGRRSHTISASQNKRGTRSGRSPVPLSSVSPQKMEASGRTTSDREEPPEHVYGLPPGLQKHEDEQDTAYKGAGGSESHHIRFAAAENDSQREARDRASSRGSSLAPPQPPPHARPGQTSGGRRQFSFQNPFHRKSHHEGEEDRPTSRGALSFTSRGGSVREYPTGNSTTEEERLGLVQGDSSIQTLPRYTEEPEEEERRSSEEWQVTSGNSSSPEVLGAGGDLGRQRRRDPYDDVSDELYDEPLQSPISRDDPSGRGGGAFV
jgi:magnesium transporter